VSRWAVREEIWACISDFSADSLVNCVEWDCAFRVSISTERDACFWSSVYALLATSML
jgi:hypothetical protein